MHAEPDRRARRAEAECQQHSGDALHHGHASGETSALQQCEISHSPHAKVFALVWQVCYDDAEYALQ